MATLDLPPERTAPKEPEVASAAPSRAEAVRRRVLADHSLLRHHLEEVFALATRVLGTEPGLEERLRRSVFDTVRAFLTHVDLEDEILVPLLRQVDAWGEARAAQIAADHEWQRAALGRLKDMADDATGIVLAQYVSSLARALLEDMRTEEETALDPAVLKP